MSKQNLSLHSSPMSIKKMREKLKKEFLKGASNCTITDVKKVGKPFTLPTGRPAQKYTFKFSCKTKK